MPITFCPVSNLPLLDKDLLNYHFTCAFASAGMRFIKKKSFFDTEDDPDNPNDEGYTPQGWANWTEQRYQLKLDHLAEVIAEIQPDILALVEVENRRVKELGAGMTCAHLK